MNAGNPRKLRHLARRIYGRARERSDAQEEIRFRTRLKVQATAPALVLSPHWDDAVLDCWSLLCSDLELNVVNLFAGIPAPGGHGVWEAVMGAPDSAARARERMAEDARALACAGREARNLPLLDERYRRQSRSAVSLDELDRALVAEVDSASHVYVPAGIGAHLDHLLARRYGRMLLRAGMPVTLYAELPYCIFHGWPHWVDGREADPARNVDAYWFSFLKDVPELPSLRSAEVTRLEESVARTKHEALESYRTSLNYAARRLLSDREFQEYEVRWPLARSNDAAAPARDEREHSTRNARS